MPSSTPAVVIDAGIGLYTVIDVPLGESAQAAWTRWQEDGVAVYAPAMWRSEVTSVLHKLFHLGQLTEAEAEAALETALTLDVQIVEADDELCRQSFRWATRLNTAAAYDAFYVALAERLGAPLWTGDRRLANNARQNGASWVYWIGDANS